MTPEERAAHPRRCTAKAKTTGDRCLQFSIPGGVVCVYHGGGSPRARAAAERRLAERKAQELLGRVWDPDAEPVLDWVPALQKLAGQLTHAVDVLGRRLDEGAGLDGPVVPLAWGKVLRELRQLLLGIGRLDLTARQIELASGQADIVVAAFRTGLAAAGSALLPDQRDIVTRAFLEALARGAEEAARPRLEIVRGEVEE